MDGPDVRRRSSPAARLPDVFTVPFTDAKTLLENGQLTDITDGRSTQLGYADKFNPNILDAVTGRRRATSTASRGRRTRMALHYNRDLFKQAGLDPDKPPTTWDEVRADAKAIAEKTGKAGYAQMTKSNTGGWQLTVAHRTPAAAACRSTTATARPRSTIDNDRHQGRRCSSCTTCAGTTTRMGSNFLLDWGAINQEFAAGKIGMYTSGSDVYTALVQRQRDRPEAATA